MLADLYMGVELHVHGLPSWMKKMNPNKMTAKDKSNILKMTHKMSAKARKSCMETEKNGARCIF